MDVICRETKIKSWTATNDRRKNAVALKRKKMRQNDRQSGRNDEIKRILRQSYRERDKE